ncbi:MAG: hypothetical protein ACOCT9_03295 [archaeon]
MFNQKLFDMNYEIIEQGSNYTVIKQGTKEVLFSYETPIVSIDRKTGETVLNKDFWNYSRTTSKHRCQFLGETKKETEKKIKQGEYKLDTL